MPWVFGKSKQVLFTTEPTFQPLQPYLKNIVIVLFISSTCELLSHSFPEASGPLAPSRGSKLPGWSRKPQRQMQASVNGHMCFLKGLPLSDFSLPQTCASKQHCWLGHSPDSGPFNKQILENRESLFLYSCIFIALKN